MAIQYPSYQIDPRMVPNFQGLGDFLNNAYKGYQMASLPEQQKADKQAQDLKNQLVTAQTQSALLKNQYMPEQEKRAESLNAAQVGNLGAQTNLAGAQTSFSQQKQQELQSKMAQDAALQKMLTSAFSGAPQGAGATQQGAQGQMQSPIPGARMLSPGNPNFSSVDAAVQSNPLLASYLAKQYGLKTETSTTVDPTTGAVIATTKYPSGAVYATGGATNEDATQRGVQQGISDAAKQTFLDINQEQKGLYENQQAIDSILNLASNPDFVNATGPANALYEKYFGKGNAANIYGKYQSNSNLLVSKMTKQEGGGRSSVALLNTMQQSKPNPNDPPEVSLGKAFAIDSTNRWNTEFNNAVINNMKNGMDSNEAMKQAMQQVPTQKYADEAQKYLDEAKIASQAKNLGFKITYKNKVPYFTASKDGKTYPLPIEAFNDWMKAK